MGSLHTRNEDKDKEIGFRAVDAVRAVLGGMLILRALAGKLLRSTPVSKVFAFLNPSRRKQNPASRIYDALRSGWIMLGILLWLAAAPLIHAKTLELDAPFEAYIQDLRFTTEPKSEAGREAIERIRAHASGRIWVSSAWWNACTKRPSKPRAYCRRGDGAARYLSSLRYRRAPGRRPGVRRRGIGQIYSGINGAL